MKKSKFITDFKDIPTPREKMPHLPLEDRKRFEEVELGFEEERAIREAKRCLSCRRCIGCGLCLAECDPRAVVYDEKDCNLTFTVNAIVLAPGFDEFDAGRIRELGYRQFPNVITSIELERILSETGPYGGTVLRPYDGDVPARIAFIQCVGSRNEALGADYCSSICCMSAMREALSLVRKIGDARVTIFHRDMRPFGKGSEEFYQGVLKEPRIALVAATVSKIEENQESKNLVVEFCSEGSSTSAGGITREEYELIVLSVGVRPSATARALSRKTGVRLDKYGFCQTDSLYPVLTSKTGVVAAGTFLGPMDVEQSVSQADAAAAVAVRTMDSGAPQAGGTNLGAKRASMESPSRNVASAVLVIGSGIAGLTAAIELSKQGHEVTVIEKEKEIGGIAARFPLAPDVLPHKGGSSGKGSSPDRTASIETLISSLHKAAEAEGRIRLLRSTELARLSGDSGRFTAVLRSDGGERKDNFGAVIASTGGKEYVPDGLLHGQDKRVITQLELAGILDAGELQGSSVAMIQCAGSRDIDWPVCARTCCAQALRNALRVKQLKPETQITILHRDIRVYFVEEELFSEAKEKGIEFVPLNESASLMSLGSRVTLNAGERLSVCFVRRGSSARETISTDYVILSTGFRPNPSARELAGILGVEIDDKGFFTEKHPAFGSVESSRKGIYICGLAHSPRSVSETIVQAMAAAEKASSFLKESAG